MAIVRRHGKAGGVGRSVVLNCWSMPLGPRDKINYDYTQTEPASNSTRAVFLILQTTLLLLMYPPIALLDKGNRVRG